MAYFLFYSIAGLMFLVVQTTLIPKIMVWGVSGNLLLVTAIYISQTRGGLMGLTLVIIFGHLLDICSSSFSGFFLYSYIMLFFVIRFVKRIVIFEERQYLVIWVGIYSVVQGVLLCILASFHYIGEGYIPSVLIRLLPQALCDMIVALIIFPLFAWFENRLDIGQVEDRQIDRFTHIEGL